MPARSRRRIAVVTGTRAEYGILRTVMRAIDAHPRLDLQLIVTGMHLLRRFGYTIREVRKDGWTIDATVRMQTDSDDPREQTVGLGKGIAGMGRALNRLDPHFVVVLGDRIEAFAAASAAVLSRRLVAHIHGGDVATGDVDDSLRHAITKLAHLHFPATRDAAKRIKRLGEDEWRIHPAGAPGLDGLRDMLTRGGENDFDPKAYAPGEDYALVVWHPCTRSVTKEKQLTGRMLAAVAAEGLAGVVLYPNSDPGHTGVIQAIERAVRRGRMNAYPSLPRDVYLRLLRRARVLVGNSSSGIIESSFLGTPSVNVGSRQEGRLRPAACVLQAAQDVDSIRRAIRRARTLRPRPGARTVYGDGRAGERIASVLAKVPLSQRLRFKKITY